MTDLMQALYIFAQEHRVMDYLHDDPEYRDAKRCADKREQTLQASLTSEQASWLDDLLGEQRIYMSAENEAAFLAGFSMAMELNRQS